MYVRSYNFRYVAMQKIARMKKTNHERYTVELLVRQKEIVIDFNQQHCRSN